jgi:hypothetical protein
MALAMVVAKLFMGGEGYLHKKSRKKLTAIVLTVWITIGLDTIFNRK